MAKISTNSLKDVIIHVSIILCTLFLLFLLFFLVYLPWSTNHGDHVKVPKIVGLSMDEAEDVLEDHDLKMEIRDCVFVAGAKPLTVLSFEPKENAIVKEGRKIHVTLTAEKAPLVSMPKVESLSLHSAEMQLKQVGLLKGEITFKPDMAENTVLEVNFNGSKITPGTKIPKGSQIDLVVGNGLGSALIDIPNVIGKPLDEAELIIKGSGLELGSVIYDEKSTSPKGTIIQQNPTKQAGKIIEGTFVDIWIAGVEPQ